MSRQMRWIAAVVFATLAASALPVEASAQKFSYTHKLTMSAEFIDDWTVRDPSHCGANGGGSVHLRLRTTKAVRFRPVYSATFKRAGASSRGLMGFIAPDSSGRAAQLAVQLSKGTLNLTDDTVPVPTAKSPCAPFDKSGCGTRPVKDGLIGLAGWDSTHLIGRADIGAAGGFTKVVNCRIGAFNNWIQPALGPDGGGFAGIGNLKIGPTTAARILHRKHMKFVAYERQSVTSHPYAGSATVLTDSIIRVINVEITKL